MNTITHPTKRTIVPLVLAIALVLSACGSGTSAGSELLPPTPVRVSASGGSGDGAAATSLAAGEAVAGDEAGRMGMIAPWFVYEFTVAGTMPALPTEANGWQYPPSPAVDLARVAQLAAALGVVGEPVARSADQGGGWLVGPDDGSAPSLYVSGDAQLNWWYSAPYSSETVVSDGCVRSVEAAPAEGGGSDAAEGSDGTTVIENPEDCVFEEPQPPTGILSADEARTRATDLMRQMGADPDGFEFEVYADEWYASVSAQQRLGALVSPVGWYFGFGAEGRLDYAGGVLAQPNEVGPYPLVGIDAAVARLTDGFFGGFMPYPADGVSLGAPDRMCEEGADCVDEVPAEPETVQVTLTGFEQELWWAWDADGTIWLLPAYTFLDADGGRYTVPAVTDEYLIIDPALVDPAVTEPAPAPADDVAVAQGDADVLIGLSEAEALDTAAARGWEIRVVERDGEGFAVTDDYRANRVNVTVTGGAVTAVTVG